MSSNFQRFTNRHHSQFVLYAGILILTMLLLGVSVLVSAVGASGTLFNVRDYGAKGDGVTDDAPAIQQAIDAAASSGGTVSLPGGTYLVGSALNLRNGTRMVGTAGQTVLTMATKSSTTFILSGSGLSNVTLDGLTMRAGSYTANVGGVYLVGAKNSQAHNLRFENLVYGMKLGSGPVGSGWVVSDIVVRNTRTPLYASHLTDSSFTNLDLEGAGTNTLDHCIYLNEQLQRVTFTNLTLTRGAGYALQLYISSGGTSSGLTFNNVTLDATNGRYPLVISGGWSNVTFKGITMKSARTDQADAKVYGISNLLMDGITASGGSALIEGDGNGATLQNGTYDGPRINASSITGLVVQNVTLGPAGSTTRTTAVSTTTTSAAPTTTTSVEPVTTTTTVPQGTTPHVIVPHAVPSLPARAHAQVLLTSPASHSVIGDRADVQASVAASVEVSKVRFYANGRVLATDYVAPYGFRWKTTGLTNGASYSLAAVAFDSGGNVIGQALETMTVLRLTNAALLPWTAWIPSSSSVFADVQRSSLYGGAISALAEASIVTGFTDGSFGPNRPTSRAQAAKIVCGALGIADGAVLSTHFVDLGPMDAELYPHKYVGALVAIGGIQGTGPTSFSPSAPVTRAQLVAIVVRSLSQLSPRALVRPPADFAPTTGTFDPSFDDAMRTAEYNDLLTGLDAFGPNWDPWASASRGEVAQVLHNLSMLG